MTNIFDCFCSGLNSIINAIFPPKCMKCLCFMGKTEYPEKSLLFSGKKFCETDTRFIRNLFSGFFCNKCMNEQDFVFFAPQSCIKYRCGSNTGRICACGMYQGILKESIHFLKYKKKIRFSRPLGILLFFTFQRYFYESRIDMILPVPLHRAKLAKRGFNQSFLLIKDFRKLYLTLEKSNPRWKIDYNILARIKNTESQTGFDKKKRKENIQGAFKVTQPGKVKDRRILLVDDVYTTGATAMEAASVLLDAGAVSVDILVLARA